MSKSLRIATALLVLCIALTSINTVFAQDSGTPLECGDIIEGETTPNDPFLKYIIQVRAGTTLNGRVEPIGSTFNLYASFRDSGDREFQYFNNNIAGLAEEFNDFVISTSNPILQIGGVSPDSTRADYFNQYFGAYTIYLGCVLRDRTVIEPGGPAPDSSQTQPINVAPPAEGFPGLAPVDFSTAFRLPLSLGTAVEGEIPAVGDAVLGFRFDGNEGDNIDLSFERTNGNLNLGLVVLSAQNQVSYMAALVTSTAMTTTFTLPSSGEYTIGVFRLDLVSPATPERTQFNLTASVK